MSAGVPFGFGPLPSINPDDLARIMGRAPLGPAQSFVPPGGAPQQPEPDATGSVTPAPMNVPLPPPRPLSFGPLPGANPQADMPAPNAVPLSGTAAPGWSTTPATPAAPAAAEPSFGDRFTSGLKANADLLMGLGTGLMSTRGFGNGLAAGLQNAQRASALSTTNDLAKADLALKQNKALREARGENATGAFLRSKGFSDELASAAMSNPTVLSSVMAQISKDPSRVTIGGNIYELRAGERPSEANLLGPSEGEKDQWQMVDVPTGDGRVQKQWIKKGEPAGQPVGAPAAGKGGDTMLEAQQRRALVISQGKDPNDPRYADFIVSGSLPKENQQQLTAADKQAIREGEDSILSHQNAIKQLQRAQELSGKAYEGFGAGTRGMVESNLPGFLGGGNEHAMATREFDNLMSTQMLDSLKAIFGGNPTEGERAALKDIQGISTMPRELRDKVIANTMAKVESRLNFEKQRVNDLRGGTYYKAQPQGTGQAPGAAPAPQPQAPDAGAVAKPQSKADYDALPSGAQYVAPDGSTRRKP